MAARGELAQHGVEVAEIGEPPPEEQNPHRSRTAPSASLTRVLFLTASWARWSLRSRAAASLRSLVLARPPRRLTAAARITNSFSQAGAAAMARATRTPVIDSRRGLRWPCHAAARSSASASIGVHGVVEAVRPEEDATNALGLLAHELRIAAARRPSCARAPRASARRAGTRRSPAADSGSAACLPACRRTRGVSSESTGLPRIAASIIALVLMPTTAAL